MSKSFYSDFVLKNRDELESYIDSIKGSLDNIEKLEINDNWKCNDNSDVLTDLNYLQGLIPSIKKSLDSYKNFLTTTDKTYNAISDNIDAELKRLSEQ